MDRVEVIEMEFQEFWKTRKRMCKVYKSERGCCLCPMDALRDRYGAEASCVLFIINNIKTSEKTVEEWAAENPIVTNKDKLKEVFGSDFYISIPANAEVSFRGVPFDEWLEKEYKQPLKP